jgi:hypothetical protein
MVSLYGGTVYFPPGYYLVVKRTITVACNGTNGVNVIGASGSGSGISNINYQGADGTACFTITGMNYSHWRGIGVNLGGTGRANQVAFDFQTAPSQVNQASNLMECCNVSMQGTGGGHIGFRFGQYSTDYSDQGSNISGTTLLHCTINGDQTYFAPNPSTSIGMQFGGSQVKVSRVIGCSVGGLGCDYLVGSIATLLSQDITEGVPGPNNTLPVDDVTLFKPNGSNTRYVVIGLYEQCTYTGVTPNTVLTTPPVPTLTPVSGSSDGNDVYVVITYVDQFTKSSGNGNGETTISPENKSTPQTTQQVQVTSPSLPSSGNVIGYNVYASYTPGGPYYLQNTSIYIAIGTNYKIPGTLNTSSRQPPVVNTTGGLTGTLTEVTRGVNGKNQAWGAGNTVEEYQLGIGVYSGGDDIVWIGCGGTSSLKIFYIQAAGGTCYSILGGRWELLAENGQRFLQTGYLASDLAQSITVENAQLVATVSFGYRLTSTLNGPAARPIHRAAPITMARTVTS